MLPTNLPLLVDTTDEGKASAITKVTSHPDNLKENLLTLGKKYKLRVHFKEPIKLQTIRRKVRLSENSWRYEYYKVSNVHVFSGFFEHNNGLCYLYKKGGRKGNWFPSLDKVDHYEVVLSEKKDAFDSYEAFKKKFDLYFITEGQIQDLWKSKSAQHGGKYSPSDFHSIGRKGKECLRRFLVNFKGVNNGGGTGYRKSPHGDYSVLSACNPALSNSGRDISIEHRSDGPMVFYSSEYANCGNGRYGLVATKNTFLWLEDD